MNQLKSFENQRWGSSDQTPEFRHLAALDLIDKGPVLDLGCGDGLFLELLKKEKGIAGIGLDISEAAVSKARAKGLDARVFDFTESKLPFKDNGFRTVILFDVLEHLYEPQKLLAEVYRVAEKSLILSVPNFVSLKPRLQVLFGGVPENNRPSKGHIYWFTYKVLRRILKSSGFQINEVRYNSVWKNKFLISHLMKILVKIRPQIFTQAFIVKAEKRDGID